MGVMTGVGSMSATTDVIYTHKKFKRAAVEAWESQVTKGNLSPNENKDGSKNFLENPASSTRGNDFEPSLEKTELADSHTIKSACKDEKHVCKLCGLVNSNYSVLQQHTCEYLKIPDRNVVCKTCKKVFTSKITYMNHDCFKFKITPRKNAENSKTNEQPKPQEPNSAAARVSFNRSFSYPNAVETSKEAGEFHYGINKEMISSTAGGKQIYKPKFRAQYSFQEDTFSSASKAAFDTDYKKNQLHFLHRDSGAGPNKDTQGYDFSTSIHPSTYHHSSTAPSIESTSSGKYNSSVFECHKDLSKGVTPQSSIWKGIKSPSPELVNQHITNLIVQNQAIVDTHNPLWSIKYRRQSSSSSVGSDIDGNQSNKSRRLSINDFNKGSKLKSVSSTEKSNEQLQSSCTSGLPKSHHHSQYISPARASKLNISSPTSLHKIKYIDVYSSNVLTQHSGETGKSPQYRGLRHIPLPANSGERQSESSTKYFSAEPTHYIIPASAPYTNDNSHMVATSRSIVTPRIIATQDVALDLQKRNSLESERSSSRESSISEPSYKNLEEESKFGSRRLSVPSNVSLNQESTFSFCQSPGKRRKLSIPEQSNRSKSPHLPFSQNGKISTPDFGFRMLDDFKSKKSNSNHIFGGEVQICDGNEYKTMKIDPCNSEAPSLDLCIASKHLNEDNASKEILPLPTSVVVTIAKSGLNSGGTMVKMDNSMRKGSLINVSVPSKLSPSSTKIETLFAQSMSETKSSLLSYSPQPPNISNSLSLKADVSIHLLKGGSMSSPLPSPNKISSSSQKDSSFSSREQNTTANLLQYPSIISFGEERVPYVPGIPGPYSQAGMIVKYASKQPDQLQILPLQKSQNVPENQAAQISPNRMGNQKLNSNRYSPHPLPATSKENDLPSVSIIERKSQPNYKYDLISTNLESAKNNSIVRNPVQGSNLIVISKPPPEIRVQPPPIEIVDLHKKDDESNDDNFLVPRKRPNTLLIKPQSLSLKSSLSLIGSTLVSPDTPRPKKSCAQLFLNGSAYTYLNLKVSTKTFFCCIYRPQPMYVLQSTNPKLSMYSNWQVRKSENPLNLTPSEAMSLHVSGLCYNRAYTISKPKSTELIVTPSSYWTSRMGLIPSKDLPTQGSSGKKESDKTQNENVSESKTPGKRSSQDDENTSPKRVKIFEGGFKTNEDYVYVRGRGRGRYVCETCGIRCKKPSMLKKHIRTHTDLRPFACKHCSFSFKTKGNLSKHLKSKAHFKRCTDMGISPVPIAVDDSHINKKALELQEMNNSDAGADCITNSDDDDEEDEDDEDDDDEEEMDEEEEIEEDEEQETKISSDVIVSLWSDEGAAVLDLTAKKSTALTGLDLSLKKATSVNSSSTSGDESLPMDLSVKRPSVIKNAEEQAASSRPNYLALENKSTGGRSSITSQPYLATIPIKEHPSDILSPVTESSVLLKSIYNTTSSLEKNPLMSPVPVSHGDGSCDNMLQAYLKERAVLDSTLKRHQYLLSSSNEQHGHDHEVCRMKSYSNTLTASDASNSSSAHQMMKHLKFISGGYPSNVVLSVSKLYSKDSKRNIDAESVIKNSKEDVLETNQNACIKEPSLAITPVPDKTISIAIKGNCESPSSIVSLSDYSSLDDVKSIQSSSVISKLSTTTVTTSKSFSICSPAVSSSNSTYTMTDNPSPKSNTSKLSSRSNSNAATSLHASSGNSIPTPPANLTVVNNCEMDSKPSFMAPSGVIPSSGARMGADDGKCRCSICHKEFAKQAQLRLHMNIHFIERPHRCDSCGISFRTNGHLQKHKRSVSHFNKMNMNQTFGAPSTENPRPFKCHDCKIAFRIHGHLAKHLRCKLHIMKLECLGKLPFGTYAEIERAGVSLNEIDTSDCENSLESLQAMALKLYEKEPSKLLAWQNQQKSELQQSRLRDRTVSNSSNNSDEYTLDELESIQSPITKSNEECDSEDEDEPSESLEPSSKVSLPLYEMGSGPTEGLLGCPQCHEKFLDVNLFEIHFYSKHDKKELSLNQ